MSASASTQIPMVSHMDGSVTSSHIEIHRGQYQVRFYTDGMTPVSIPSVDERVWRYMSFSRFLWLLQKKQLWLTRADLLGDPWEIALAGEQLAHVISRHPPAPFPSRGARRETAIERSKRIIQTWRRDTFVSCWSALEHESHALWRIYCRSTEGVAVQTTLARLKESVGGLQVYRVTYQTPGTAKQTPTLTDLVTKKRPMFAYEQEVRVVLTRDGKDEAEILGHRLEWDPEKNIESIRIHPEADDSFMETVTKAVETYAPTLKERVLWSAMRTPPPF